VNQSLNVTCMKGVGIRTEEISKSMARARSGNIFETALIRKGDTLHNLSLMKPLGPPAWTFFWGQEPWKGDLRLFVK